MIKKPFALSLSKRECGSTSSPRTLSFYCALALYYVFWNIPWLKKQATERSRELIEDEEFFVCADLFAPTNLIPIHLT